MRGRPPGPLIVFRPPIAGRCTPVGVAAEVVMVETETRRWWRGAEAAALGGTGWASGGDQAGPPGRR